MNKKKNEKPLNYPWYKSGIWDNLEQGDLLPNCPVLTPPETLSSFLISAKIGDELEIPSIIQTLDLIIMSQTCDLMHDKIKQVLLCGYFDATVFGNKDARKSIRKEQRPALHMIEECEIPNFNFGQKVIDFRVIYTLPKDFLLSFTEEILSERVRLLPPYKEHLSQSFARYFMRVGLPRPLEEL